MTVSIPSLDGKSEFSAYLAIPRRPTAGLVVLQEIFGVNANMRAVCDFFASRQLVALAPDLFSRVEPNVELAESEVERARTLRSKVDDNQASDDAAAAMDWLRKHPSCTGHVGVVGYCWGGMLAYLTAVRHKPEAAVSYYGVGIEQKLSLAQNLACPLMLHFAELDKYAPAAVIAQVRAAYKDDPRVTIFEYPGCDHAFARKNGHNFSPYNADQADMRTLSFFVDKLIGRR
jgi:carboxymethylenebutenolidase